MNWVSDHQTEAYCENVCGRGCIYCNHGAVKDTEEGKKALSVLQEVNGTILESSSKQNVESGKIVPSEIDTKAFLFALKSMRMGLQAEARVT